MKVDIQLSSRHSGQAAALGFLAESYLGLALILKVKLFLFQPIANARTQTQARRTMDAIFVTLESESLPAHPKYCRALLAETDHTEVIKNAHVHFRTDKLEVVHTGEFVITLKELLQQCEQRRTGATNKVLGEQPSEEGVFVTRTARYMLQTNPHISPDGTLPAPATIAKEDGESDDEGNPASTGVSAPRKSNKKPSPTWLKQLRLAAQKLYPRSPDGSRFLLVSAEIAVHNQYAATHA